MFIIVLINLAIAKVLVAIHKNVEQSCLKGTIDQTECIITEYLNFLFVFTFYPILWILLIKNAIKGNYLWLLFYVVVAFIVSL